jgi:RNA polymerase-binding protein DksA
MKHLAVPQLERLTAQLQDRTRVLAVRIREELAASEQQHFRDLAGSVTDTADEALADALVDLDAAIVDRHVAELRDIDAARERMANGAYGICSDCGDDVAYERLAAYPTAKRCLQCQQLREHNFAHQATPSL